MKIRLALLPAVLCGVLCGADFGLPTGTPMPAFEAQDQNGKTHTLQSVLGPKGGILVFFRSADW